MFDGGCGRSVVLMYVVGDTSADGVGGVDQAKIFLTQADLLQVSAAIYHVGYTLLLLSDRRRLLLEVSCISTSKTNVDALIFV